MKVTVINNNSVNKETVHDSVIGEFCVVIKSLDTLCKQPQFFNVLTPDGKLVGQILANFFIKHIEKKID